MFKHYITGNKHKNKQLFELIVLNNIWNEIQNKLLGGNGLNSNFDTSDIFTNNNIYDVHDIMNKSEKVYYGFIVEEYIKLWPMVDAILDLYDKCKYKISKTQEISDLVDSTPNVAFVDGSCIKNTNDREKFIGYGGVLYLNGNNDKRKGLAFKGILKNKLLLNLENIGGELMATLTAIDMAIKNNWKTVNICHDYLGIAEYANGHWVSKNDGVNFYVSEINKRKKKIDISFIKVPAHSGIRGNEIADFYVNNYKLIFKTLMVLEMLLLNSNLNGLTLDELFLNGKIK